MPFITEKNTAFNIAPPPPVAITDNPNSSAPRTARRSGRHRQDDLRSRHTKLRRQGIDQKQAKSKASAITPS
jgi:hypothetical protein